MRCCVSFNIGLHDDLLNGLFLQRLPVTIARYTGYKVNREMSALSHLRTLGSAVPDYPGLWQYRIIPGL